MMTSSKHPALGPIHPMPPGRLPKKVWKHFYSPTEHWDRLCEADVGALRSRTEEIVGLKRDHYEELETQVERQARNALTTDHDRWYGPVYGREVAEPHTKWTPNLDERCRHNALSPRSVFIVVQLDQPSWIVTAFRPHPRFRTRELNEAELRRHACDYFRRRTGTNVETLVKSIAENLRRSTETPNTVNELWWLAAAVGYGRMVAQYPSIIAPLALAEAALSKTSPGLRAELARELDWEVALGGIAAGLHEERPEDIEGALADAEDLLAAANALGADRDVETFLNEIAPLIIASLPSDWSHIGDFATQRLSMFGDTAGPLSKLWAAVADASTASLVRETARAPTESPWSNLRVRIAKLTGRASRTLDEWVETSLDGLSVAQPAPTLGTPARVGDPWFVEGRPAAGAPSYRVFVVDDDHSTGFEVTSQFTAEDGRLWTIDAREDQALVVIFAAPTPIDGATLEEVLSNAAARDDVAVRFRELQPTQVTKAER